MVFLYWQHPQSSLGSTLQQGIGTRVIPRPFFPLSSQTDVYGNFNVHSCSSAYCTCTRGRDRLCTVCNSVRRIEDPHLVSTWSRASPLNLLSIVLVCRSPTLNSLESLSINCATGDLSADLLMSFKLWVTVIETVYFVTKTFVCRISCLSNWITKDVCL